MNLDITHLENLAAIDFETFKALHLQNQNRAAVYYQSLALEAESVGLLHVQDYADNALNVVNNNTVSGVLVNNFVARVAANHQIDYSPGSDIRLQVQYDLMINDVQARIQNLSNGGTGELDYQDTMNIVSGALQSSGLPPTASPLYVPLSILGEHDPDRAQFLFQTVLVGDGLLDVVQDGLLLGFGANISSGQRLSEILKDYSAQSYWLSYVAQAMEDFVLEYSSDPNLDEISGRLETVQKIAELGGATFDQLAGWADFLEEFSETDPWPTINLPSWLAEKLAAIDAAGSINWEGVMLGGGDPLVFDLNGDGNIALTSIENGVHFDFWGDGFAEKTSWVGPEDGILVWDQNADGLISDFSELIASPHPLTFITDADHLDLNEEAGFAQLALLDDNGDGVIDANDAIYTALQIWQDANSNGISDSGELHTLSSLGIVSIDLAGVQTTLWSGGGFTRVIEGNVITHASTFTLSDGSTREVVDAWLNQEWRESYYTEDYTLDIRTLFLPTLRGYGNLPDLHITMSSNEGLLTEVQDFAAARTFDQLFSDFSGVREDMRDILMKWADVDEAAVAASPIPEHGIYTYIPEFMFLRKLTGVESPYIGSWFDARPFMPWPSQGAQAVFSGWEGVLDAFTARMVFQSGGSALFAGAVYNPLSDVFEGDLGLVQASVDALAAAVTGHADLEGAWHNIAQFLDDTRGLDDLTATENGWLDSAVAASSAGVLDWADIVATLEGQIINGVVGDDTLHGTRWNDILNDFHQNGASAGNETIYGYEGDDILFGGLGDDVLVGGSGNDVYYGDNGNNTYVYESGHDVIVNQGSPDAETIRFGPGILPEDVTLRILKADIPTPQTFFDIAGRGTLTIQQDMAGWTTMADQIDEVHFDDGTIWLFPDIPVIIEGTYDDDRSMTSLGLSAPATVYLYDGDDEFAIGVEHGITIDAGAGDDVITTYAFSSNDTFIFSPGNDRISDGGGTDTLVIPEGYDLTDIQFYRVHEDGFHNFVDGLIKIEGLGQIFISRQFLSDNDGIYTFSIENLKFHDGSVVALDTLIPLTKGSDGDDYITASSYFNGVESIDLPSIYDPGAGDDTINGGKADDVYIFSEGKNIIHDLGGFDTLQIPSAYSVGDISLNMHYEHSHHSLLVFDQLGNEMLFYRHFNGTGTVGSNPHMLERIEFADGTIINLDQVEVEAHGTENDDDIYGADVGDKSADDWLFGYAGDDNLSGGNGNDYLSGGPGNDNIYGGIGDDELYGDESDDFILGGTGEDIIHGGDGDDLIRGEEDDDVIYGDAGDDIIYGDANGITSNAGDDILSGGTGNNILYGGLGDDTYLYAGGFDIIQDDGGVNDTVILAEGITQADIQVYHALSNALLLDISGDMAGHIFILYHRNANYGHIENIRFFDGTLIDQTPDNPANTYFGTPENEFLYGVDADIDETFYGFGGGDIIYAYGGNDILIGGEGTDTFYGGDGVDTFVYQSINDAGDTIIDFDAAAGEKIDLFLLFDGLAGFDSQNALTEGFIRTEQDGQNTKLFVDLDGTAGGAEAEVLLATLNNTLASAVTLDNFILPVTGIFGTSGDDILLGTAGDDTIYGEDGNDSIFGLEDDDLIYGGAGNDTIFGDGNWGASYGGNDTIYGEDGDDLIHGRAGDDVLYGGNGSDNLNGQEGNDTLYGGAGFDRLYGGDGDDTLYGSSGGDFLYGGAGNDTFIFEDLADYAGHVPNQIKDGFDTGDIIDISALIDYDPLTDDLSEFVIMTDNGNTRLSIDPDGGPNNYNLTVVISGVSGQWTSAQDMIDQGNLIVS